MSLPVAQTLSPNLAFLFADYDRLRPVYNRAATRERHLLEAFDRSKPRGEDKAATLRADLGIDLAASQVEKLHEELEPVLLAIYDAEPTTWTDLAAIARVLRERNGTRRDGATIGLSSEIPIDFARHIERIGAEMAEAEAADAVVIEMVARYEAMGAVESRMDHEPDFEAEYDRLYDAIAAWCPRTLQGLGAMAKAARLRGSSDDLCAIVAKHAEALAALPPGTAMAREDGPAVGSLEAIAYEAEQAFQRCNAFERAHSEAEAAGRPLAAKALWASAVTATADIGHAFDRGLDIPARSFADVLAGLVAIAHNVEEFAHYHEDPVVEARMEVIQEKVKRRLYGLRGFVERFAGVSSDALCGAYCFSSAFDPFTNPEVPLDLKLADRCGAEMDAA